MALLTMSELRVWVRRPSLPDTDEFGLAVIAASSLVVSEECGFPVPEWTPTTAPAIARQVAIQLAKRTFLNPDAVVAEGGIGPIGGDRFIDDFARTLELTAAEKAQLARIDGNVSASEQGLWVQRIDPADADYDSIVYVYDSSGSNWAIPMLDVDVDLYYKPLVATPVVAPVVP